jgi:DNA-binding NtrC family response regulator
MAHICICDDEEGILLYLKKRLKGHRVETFSRGSDLLARLEQADAAGVDLLLQDHDDRIRYRGRRSAGHQTGRL